MIGSQLNNVKAEENLFHAGDPSNNEKCGKKFNKEKPMFLCPEEFCGKYFRGKGNLKVHLRSHMMVKPYKCELPDCVKTFSTRGNLKCHILIHKNIKPFECSFEGCGNKYINISRLKVHERTHLGRKPFFCQVCDKGFNEKGNLKTHMRIHTGERPFKCNVEGCSSTFKTSGHLKDHMKIHLDIKPYKCQFCFKQYSRACTLKIHLRTHTGEKPFKCPHEGCGKSFSEKGNMRNHAKKHMKEADLSAKFKLNHPFETLTSVELTNSEHDSVEVGSNHQISKINQINKNSNLISANNFDEEKNTQPQPKRNFSTDFVTEHKQPSFLDQVDMYIDSDSNREFDFMNNLTCNNDYLSNSNLCVENYVYSHQNLQVEGTSNINILHHYENLYYDNHQKFDNSPKNNLEWFFK